MIRKKKRKVCYICGPHIGFDLICPNNSEHKITWSEYEHHIWCCDCKKDIKYEPGGSVVAWELSQLLGVDYRRYNIKTGEIIEYNE